MIDAMIENLNSYCRSSHDDNILDQIMLLYVLKWRFVIVAILLALEDFITILNYLMKEFELKDIRKTKFCKSGTFQMVCECINQT